MSECALFRLTFRICAYNEVSQTCRQDIRVKHNRKSVLLSRRPLGPPPLSKRALSVIIPVRDSLPELHQCLQALSSNQGPLTELIVVDDCSSADVAEVAAQYGARYFRLPLHQGPAAARNQGAQHAAGEIFIFIDADVMVAPNTLTIIREKFDSNPDLDALFGSYDDSPQHTDFCSSYKNLLHHYTHQHSEEEATTFWSGCGAIRKKAFEDVKGFDEGTYPVASIEDIDLGLRLRQKGLKIQLVKRLQVKHLKKWTLGSLVRTDIFQRAVPWTKLIVRSGYLPHDLNLSWESRLSTFLVAVSILLLAVIHRATILGPRASFSLALVFAAIVASLLILNGKLYSCFLRKRGPAFSAAAILFHWIYLLYSGTVFLCCGAFELLRELVHPISKDTSETVAPPSNSDLLPAAEPGHDD